MGCARFTLRAAIASRRPNRTRSFAAVINLTAAVMALK
jgi:hypothetical protein